jgi:hypothetical protein
MWAKDQQQAIDNLRQGKHVAGSSVSINGRVSSKERDYPGQLVAEEAS